MCLYYKYICECEQFGLNNKFVVMFLEFVEFCIEQDFLGLNIKFNVEEIFIDFEYYYFCCKGWIWWNVLEEGIDMGDFYYWNMFILLKQSMFLFVVEYFENIDFQLVFVVIFEIVFGYFEDDLCCMRMVVWYGVDYIMVICIIGQSYIDGLLEGILEGIGGVLIICKQLCVSCKVCDFIEDEVGCFINFYFYVFGVVGFEVVVFFVEEGVNGVY